MTEPTPTEMRNHVDKLAPTDVDSAVGLARSISDPWFACQALGSVARYARPADVNGFALEAIGRVFHDVDGYRVIAPSCWPIRALIERGHMRIAREQIDRLLPRANMTKPMSIRSEALFLLFQATWPGGKQLWAPVYEAFVEASIPIKHWRQARALRDIACILYGKENTLFDELMQRIPEERDRIDRTIQKRGGSEVRRFFLVQVVQRPSSASRLVPSDKQPRQDV